MIAHVAPATAHLITPAGQFAFHPIQESAEPFSVSLIRVAVCGYCGSSPQSPQARSCTSVRCPLIKSDAHNGERDAA